LYHCFFLYLFAKITAPTVKPVGLLQIKSKTLRMLSILQSIEFSNGKVAKLLAQHLFLLILTTINHFMD
jgi:hypothetical protein